MSPWLPPGIKPPRAIEPGLHRGYLVEAAYGLTSKKRLPKLDLGFIVENREVSFTLVFGAHPMVDARNGWIVDSLHKIANLALAAEPDWATLLECLDGRLLMIAVGINPKTGDIQLEKIVGGAKSGREERLHSQAPSLNDWEGADPAEVEDDDV